MYRNSVIEAIALFYSLIVKGITTANIWGENTFNPASWATVLCGQVWELFAAVHQSMVRHSLIRFFQIKFSKTKHVRRPGIEPGSQEWESCMIPLHQRRPWNVWRPQSLNSLMPAFALSANCNGDDNSYILQFGETLKSHATEDTSQRSNFTKLCYFIWKKNGSTHLLWKYN